MTVVSIEHNCISCVNDDPYSSARGVTSYASKSFVSICGYYSNLYLLSIIELLWRLHQLDAFQVATPKSRNTYLIFPAAIAWRHDMISTDNLSMKSCKK
jgi:hypothetical protein